MIVAAAKVGGIAFNNAYPVDFLADNLAIALNVIRASHAAGVKKLLFLGSSCIYPKLAPQPMREEMLLTGSLEPTNEWYALAKIAGIKLVEAYRRQYGVDFISVMPTNLYGPGDNYHPEHSHVPAALIRRLHEAKLAGAPTVTVWGSGQPRREFLAVDDLADACVFVMKHYSASEFLNVGTGQDMTIAEVRALRRRCRRLSRAARFRHLAPRRCAAKAVGCVEADATWLARARLAAGGNCSSLCRFSRRRRVDAFSSRWKRTFRIRIFPLTLRHSTPRHPAAQHIKCGVSLSFDYWRGRFFGSSASAAQVEPIRCWLKFNRVTTSEHGESGWALFSDELSGCRPSGAPLYVDDWERHLVFGFRGAVLLSRSCGTVGTLRSWKLHAVHI